MGALPFTLCNNVTNGAAIQVGSLLSSTRAMVAVTLPCEALIINFRDEMQSFDILVTPDDDN